MDAEEKHGLPKVVALADKLARLVLDQIEKGGCGNLENIRNALVGPLAQDEMDRQACKAKAREQWEGAAQPIPGVKGPVGPIGPSATDDAVMVHKLWCRDGDIDLRPSRHLLKAFGDAIASGAAREHQRRNLCPAGRRSSDRAGNDHEERDGWTAITKSSGSSGIRTSCA